MSSNVGSSLQGKRPKRTSRACDRCRSRKAKCDGDYPCSRCRSAMTNCVYRQHYRAMADSAKTANNPSSSSSSSSSSRALAHHSLSARHYVDDTTNYYYNKRVLSPMGRISQSSLYSLPVEEMLKMMGPLASTSSSSSIPFYGLTSNVSFIQSFCRFLTGSSGNSSLPEQLNLIKSSTIFFRKPAALENFDYLANEATMLHLVSSFFDHMQLMIPLFIPEDFISMAKALWKRSEAELEADPGIDRYVMASIYLVMANGATCLPVSTPIAGVLPGDWSVTYFQRSRRLMTDYMYDINLNTIPCLILTASYLRFRGDSPASYMFSGSAVQACLSLGVHVSANDDGGNSSDSIHINNNIHRIWISVYTFTSMISFSLGHQNPANLVGVNNPPIQPRESAFLTIHPSGSHFEYIKLSVQLSQLETKIQNELYNGRITSDLNSLFQIVARESAALDQIFASFPQFNSDIPPMNKHDDFPNPSDIAERWWARLMYYHVRLVIHRPIMIVAAFLRTRNSSSSSQSAPFNLLENNDHARLYVGLRNCLEAAMSIPNMMIRVEETYPSHYYLMQRMWLNGLYLEWACFIILFYIASLHDLLTSSEVERLSNLLDRVNICLESTEGPIAESDKLLAADGVKILRLYFPQCFGNDDDVDLGPMSARTMQMNTYLAELLRQRQEQQEQQKAFTEDHNNNNNSFDEDNNSIDSQQDKVNDETINPQSSIHDSSTELPPTPNWTANDIPNPSLDVEFDANDFERFWETSVMWMS